MYMLEDKAGKFCIKFDEIIRDTCERCRENFLYIQSPGLGCSSHLGMVGGGRQALNISRVGCIHEGIIIHELMHALGFVHEHTRPDRDSFIEVHMENVEPGRILLLTYRK